MTEQDTSKKAIMKAARSEFARRGFSGARMADIAKEAGVNKALIHYYYGNKEALYRQVLEQIIGMEEDISSSVFAPGWELSSPQQLYLFIYMFVSVTLKVASETEYRIFLWEFAEGGRFIRDYIDERIRPRQNILKNIIEEGIRQNVFETDNVDLVAGGIISQLQDFGAYSVMYRESMNELFFFGDISAEEFIETFSRNILKMLSPAGTVLPLPEMPAGLMNQLDNMLEYFSAKKREGELFAHVRMMMELFQKGITQ